MPRGRVSNLLLPGNQGIRLGFHSFSTAILLSYIPISSALADNPNRHIS